MVTLEERCRKIELLLSDVDGVLTDGRLVYDNQGVETKAFHVRDGLGIKLWQASGYEFGVVTQRSSQIVKVRTGELGVSIVRQAVNDKMAVVQELIEERDLSLEQVAYLGDDLPDLAVVRAVGLGIAVADAAGEVREAAGCVTNAAGGRGAVREAVEMILKNQGRWETVIQRYYG